jgi:hypothetical protein
MIIIDTSYQIMFYTVIITMLIISLIQDVSKPCGSANMVVPNLGSEILNLSHAEVLSKRLSFYISEVMQE